MITKTVLLTAALISLSGCAVYPYHSPVVYAPPPVVYAPPPVIFYGHRPAYRHHHYHYWR